MTPLAHPGLKAAMMAAWRLAADSGGRLEAEDLAQEALVRSWVARTRRDPSRHIGPWFMAILRNVARDRLKSFGVRRRAPGGLDPVAGIVDDSTLTPWGALERRELEAAVASAILSLRPRLRQAARLTLDGLTIAEAAAASRVPLGTARSRRYRALARMAWALAEWGRP